MKIIAHRGGANLAPENSIEAIKLAKGLGVDAAEIDIHLTSDGKLVVFHDPTLKRLAGLDTRIDMMTLSDLRKITLNNGAKIPTLKEVIKAAGDMTLVIEGKGGHWAKLLDREIRETRFKNPPMVISFNTDELDKFNKLNNIDCYILEIFRGFSAIKVAKKHGFKGIDIHRFALLNPHLYKKAKENGLEVAIFTVNSAKKAKFYADRYPDIAIATDSPDKLLEIKS